MTAAFDRPAIRTFALPAPSTLAAPNIPGAEISPLAPARARLHRHLRNMAFWTMQGWLCMFFVAAGYAKLTEPTALLEVLMTWPALVDPWVVDAVGIAEIVAGALMLAGLASWTPGRPVVIGAALLLAVAAATALVFHGLEGHLGHALTNLALLALAIAVAAGRAGMLGPWR